MCGGSCPSDKWFKLIIHYAKKIGFFPVVRSFCWCCCCRYCSWSSIVRDLITAHIDSFINQLRIIAERVSSFCDLNLTNYIVNILYGRFVFWRLYESKYFTINMNYEVRRAHVDYIIYCPSKLNPMNVFFLFLSFEIRTNHWLSWQITLPSNDTMCKIQVDFSSILIDKIWNIANFFLLFLANCSLFARVLIEQIYFQSLCLDIELSTKKNLTLIERFKMKKQHQKSIDFSILIVSLINHCRAYRTNQTKHRP